MQATNTAALAPYPIRVEGRMEQTSRWSWLVKWLLALPHFVVLAGLWLAFALSSAASCRVLPATSRPACHGGARLALRRRITGRAYAL